MSNLLSCSTHKRPIVNSNNNQFCRIYKILLTTGLIKELTFVWQNYSNFQICLMNYNFIELLDTDKNCWKIFRLPSNTIQNSSHPRGQTHFRRQFISFFSAMERNFECFSKLCTNCEYWRGVLSGLDFGMYEWDFQFLMPNNLPWPWE